MGVFCLDPQNSRQGVEEIVRRADVKGQIIGVSLAPESEEDEDTP